MPEKEQELTTEPKPKGTDKGKGKGKKKDKEKPTDSQDKENGGSQGSKDGDRQVISSTLFVDEEGKSMRFKMDLGREKKEVYELVTRGGGTWTNKNDSIRCAAALRCWLILVSKADRTSFNGKAQEPCYTPV